MKLANTGILLALLFFVQPSAAQLNTIPLRRVLTDLEQRHQVSFTYLDEDISPVSLPPPPDSLSLSKALDYLNKETGLTFSVLNDRFIAIRKSQASDVRVCGRLLDQLNREPVAGAVVQTGDQYAVTNEAGDFQIRLSSNKAELLIRALGYETLRLTGADFPAEPCREFLLELTTQWLPGVLINSYPTLGISKLLEGSYSIQTQSLGILPGLIEPDVLFAAQTLPGVQSIDETVSNINVRAGTQDQNMLIWEGMRMYQPGHFFGLISAFNPQITRSVKLTKNGTFAAYGESVSSTIDIRSDNAVATAIRGGAGVNLISADAHLTIPLSPRSSAQVAFRRSLADIVTTPAYKKYYDRAFQGTLITEAPPDSATQSEQFIFYDLSVKYLLDITPKDKIRLNVFQAKNDIQVESTLLQTGETRRSSLNQQSSAGGFTYAHNWSSRLTTLAAGYISNYQLSSVNQDVQVNQELQQGNEVLDLGLRVESRWLLSSRIDLLLGYQYNDVGVTQREAINNPPFNKNKKEVIRTNTLYAEGTYTSADRKSTINLGLRTPYFGKLEVLHLEPRLAISRKLSDRFTLELLGELKSQTMVQVIDLQNDFLGVEKRKWVLANNQDIPWVSSGQVSFGAHYQHQEFLFSMEVFGKSVRNILSSSQGFLDQHQYVRVPGSYTAYGLELLASRSRKHLTLWASYGLSSSDYTFDLFTPSQFRNNFDIRHRLTVGITYQRGHWEVAAGLNGRTGKPYTPPDATLTTNGNVSYQDPNTAELPYYARVDFSLRYNFQLSVGVKAIAGVSVWNLLDRDNLINIYFVPGTSGVPVAQQQKALSLTPNLMFRVEF